ncbi:DNA alkylation repair protein [Cryobacterium tagatosivorans]|uniref:DNA alkylation repair protein n=1 Tax=Cryobacterium tagatosivorans TaxID=1259199 RepID=A0A4R8UEW9_9MICO|nr:DNA alkylation repair protein [Cryobacterium tagatosivorans]TFB52253.1 DNA alkylation repair protein [Cryobacterium tagatosivorans]
MTDSAQAHTAVEVRAALDALADPERAILVARYFQTGPGQYGEGDVFIGLRLPDIRQVAAGFVALPLPEVEELLRSEVHEHRLAALLILVGRFRRAGRARTRDEAERTRLSEFYLAAVRRGVVNNWDLVDVSAPTLLGEYLVDRPRDVLFELAGSDSLWQRRVAMLASSAFLAHGDTATTLALAEKLLGDKESLIHKAVGWMLREVGKVDPALLLAFLDANAGRMARTALSYATEHLEPDVRARYRAR